jgi:secondary thiamine-phosphate synthase enzyme
MQTISVRSRQREQMIDVTDEVAAALREDGGGSGTALIFVPHTTAAVTINENADPDVVHDLLAKLSQMAPQEESYYRHGEGNSAAHVKSSLLGASLMVVVEDGRPVLGTWQGVYFCEFDGPRSRQLHVQMMKR